VRVVSGSGYASGVRVEHAVIHALTQAGYECTRAASSKGVADVIAIGDREVLLVNVKRTTPPGPGERAALLRVADRLGPVAVPLVAIGPSSRLTWRVLTGPAADEFLTWEATA
jgi:Holliday junction resolvase